MPPLRNTGSAPEAEHPDYAGRYPLEGVLGAGGMGVVHLATSDSGLRLAVKVVHANHASDPEFRARFRQEIMAARRVSGAFTAPVVDADPDAERPWMATLFIDGPTLSDRVRRTGPLGTGELVRLGAGLAEGLRDIHRAGVVHRDLKPGNVLLAADGPKVIDFGISRPADSDLRTETGKLIGTPPFMAPEQFQRPREVGPAADVFAMGAVLVHAATGRGPFDSDSPYIVAYQVVHDEPDLAGVPDQLLPLVSRCLAKEPADRPTPDEVMTALRTGHGHAPGAAPLDRTGVEEAGRTGVARGGATPLVPAQRRPEEATAGDPAPATHPRAPEGHGTAGDVEPTAGGGAAGSGGTAGGGGAARVGGAAEGGGTAGKGGTAGNGGGTPADRPSPLRPALRPALRLSRRTSRLVAAGAVVATLAVAGFVGVRVLGDGSDGTAARDPSRGRAEGAFRPWHTTLHSGTGGNRMPVCSTGVTGSGDAGDSGGDSDGDPGVYCSAPGLTAARLDPADGAVDWSVRDSRTTSDADEAAAPVLCGGLLHVITSGGTRLEALDPTSGERRWEAGLSSYAGIQHTGDTVLLLTYDGLVRALDGATGEERWAERRGGPGAMWTASPEGRLFAVTPAPDGSTTEVSAVDPANGALLWEKRPAGNLRPAGSSGRALFLLADDTDGITEAVVRVDTASRTVRRVTLTAPVDQAQATVGDDGTVYVIGYAGSLLAVGMEAGGGPADDGPGGDRQGDDEQGAAERWRLETSVTRASRPTVAGGHLFLSAGDGRLLAVSTERGVLVGQTEPRMSEGKYTLSGTLPAPVTDPSGRVFATAPDGSVFAVPGRDPARW
ncbi:serine/threonine-protein kinase [Streptomyces sp. NPDC095613]|uniref:serine/threonine-protein kinase n=1 Tax=Streptomyces sp. NPDC095613 TaxID=3155540 RepID=UPI003331160D